MCDLAKFSGLGLLGCFLILLLLAGWVYQGAASFDPVMPARLAKGEARILSQGQSLKVMNWNVQYFAGKNYVFYYDLPHYAGPDTRPSPEDIEQSLSSAARIIDDEAPDILLLQEVDEGASRTDGQDQTEALQGLLKGRYPFKAEAFYWKARFVPHPKIMGSVGMKLVILSKYRIATATRIALPRAQRDAFTDRLNLQRCLLTAELPVEGGGRLVLINLHLEAFPETPDLLARQLQALETTIAAAQNQGAPFIAGGDFNLLPPGQYDVLPDHQRTLYRMDGEMAPLFERYTVVPGLAETHPSHPAPWYTHFPNDPDVTGPDRTLDYLLFPKEMTLQSKQVRTQGAIRISDHLPVMATVQVP
ncbi:endonuclease [Desulfoluna limicola]|uniref:Endonuclease n=1 Tax=Desulfoluna limicola TaxID=2810562 RepID=A0ABM7PC19_9BACT|nr:endonuclease/exonuclease/phosphatase family protein [Desulfoluna limicola]BCS94737.1 endonuclease [Desulfoluna limicola]